MNFFAVALFLVIQLCLAEELRAPGGRGCELEASEYGSGIHPASITVDGLQRSYMLFVPDSYQHHHRVALWLAAPGAFQTGGAFLNISQLVPFANRKGIALAVLDPASPEGLNVGMHGQGLSHLADDIAYTRAVLRHASSKICINMDRIRCTGYARGGRFCSRLASELSSFITGIAPVAGLRFPWPNNASSHMPVIAVHGSMDPVDPYWGDGDPDYWNASVPDAVQRWSTFNRCQYQRWTRDTKHVAFLQHFDCRNDASVVLVVVDGDGHTWPGSDAFSLSPQLGNATREEVANDLIWNFFVKHPVEPGCRTALPGDRCFDEIMKAMRSDAQSHPEIQGHRPNTTSVEEYQYMLHYGILADCPRPCQRPTSSTILVDLAEEGSHDAPRRKHVFGLNWMDQMSVRWMAIGGMSGALVCIIINAVLWCRTSTPYVSLVKKHQRSDAALRFGVQLSCTAAPNRCITLESGDESLSRDALVASSLAV